MLGFVCLSDSNAPFPVILTTHLQQKNYYSHLTGLETEVRKIPQGHRASTWEVDLALLCSHGSDSTQEGLFCHHPWLLLACALPTLYLRVCVTPLYSSCTTAFLPFRVICNWIVRISFLKVIPPELSSRSVWSHGTSLFPANVFAICLHQVWGTCQTMPSFPRMNSMTREMIRLLWLRVFLPVPSPGSSPSLEQN